MKVAILYDKFFDHDGRNRLIGGIETYILNLARLCHEMGMEATIYQWSNLPFVRNVDGLKVKGVPVCHLPYKRIRPAFFRVVVGEINESKDILVFGADSINVPTQSPRHISIQHGVSWDLPVQYLTHRRIVRYEWAARVKKWRAIQASKRSFENCRNTVCVDFNFLNWYRTIVTKEPEGHRVWVILNFSPIASDADIQKRSYENKDVRILFARRFEQYRGTRIMAEATRHVLCENANVMVTFAGDGPDGDWLRTHFTEEPRVCFTRYMPDEALRVHLKHDVAVVPSLASEGTSLSVAEAMGAGCAVVATAVGGITNMVIDGYNGILVLPNADSLYKGIASVVKSPNLRRQLGERAYDTAAASFGIERWKHQWKEVLLETANA